MTSRVRTDSCARWSRPPRAHSRCAFGTSVALSADGSALVIGAPDESSAAAGIAGDQSDDSASLAGAAYEFTRSAMTWAQRAYIKASNTRPQLLFGTAVALPADASIVVVGGDSAAPSGTGVGTVYLYD